MLDIDVNYHFMQFQRKLMNLFLENGKKPSFSPDFGAFLPKFGPQKFFLWVLPLLDVIHCCKLSLYAISRITPNLRKRQKIPLVFVSIFAPLA